ncbi:Macrophage-expressed protein 1 protein [Bulinus truncatus]|nr:Macrophage-expressed protein 1 protein [Bulinus truncatus]
MADLVYPQVLVLFVALANSLVSCTQLQGDNLGVIQSDWPVLPGVGWDNLRNLEAGLVVTYNFTHCKLTDDGNLLIPDNVFTVPVKSSRVERFAELIDQWHNSSSLTANTINVDAGMSLGIVSISGTYSSEHQELKSKQIEDKATTVRVQMRYYRYEAKLQPDPVLSPQFKSRLLSIAARIELNQTEQARYEGQLLVRDFGTHVLTSVTAGAALIKDDYLKAGFIQDNSESKASILATASASFLNIFHFSASYGHSTDNKLSNSYTNSLTHSLVKTLGGPVIQPENISIDAWAKGIDTNLIPLDRAGDPLYFMVTAQTLPELPPTTVIEVEQVVRQSIELYYEMNTIRGCTQLGSPNFSFSANFNDGSCTGRSTNVTFGATGRVPLNSGYLFGGLYRPTMVNPVTGTMGCPPTFYPRNILSDTTICLSDDFEQSGPLSVPFGGFFTCKAGNPLAADGVSPVGLEAKSSTLNSLKSFMARQSDPSTTYPMRCPEGYSQHLATVDMGCSVNYCVKSGALTGPNLPPVKRPPFMSKPTTVIDYGDKLFVFDINTQGWIKNDKTHALQTLQAAFLENKNSKDGLSPGAAAGISVGVTLVCVAVAHVVIFAIRRHRARGSSTYIRLVSPPNYGVISSDSDNAVV